MIRSKSLIAAVVLQIVIGILAVSSALRILSAGIGGAAPMPGGEEMGGPPFWAGVMFLTLAIAIFFSAYGLWIGQKWGKVVAIVTNVILAIFALGDLVGSISVSAYDYAALSAFYFALHLAVIILVLRREPKLVTA